MKATINDHAVEGTPMEIAEFMHFLNRPKKAEDPVAQVIAHVTRKKRRPEHQFKRWTQTEIDRAVNMRAEEKLTNRQIAILLGRTTSSVAQMFYKAAKKPITEEPIKHGFFGSNAR